VGAEYSGQTSARKVVLPYMPILVCNAPRAKSKRTQKRYIDSMHSGEGMLFLISKVKCVCHVGCRHTRVFIENPASYRLCCASFYAHEKDKSWIAEASYRFSPFAELDKNGSHLALDSVD
jgi:hypothetical protein